MPSLKGFLFSSAPVIIFLIKVPVVYVKYSSDGDDDDEELGELLQKINS